MSSKPGSFIILLKQNHAGHGLYKNTMEVDKKDPYGELLISVTGQACYIDRITLTVLVAGREGTFDPNTLFCFLFDCCR